MKKTVIRFLAVILSALMVMTALPLTGFADTGVYVWDASGTKYTLTPGINSTDMAKLNVSWTQSNAYSTYRLTLSDGFKGTAIASDSDLYIYLQGSATITGGALASGATGSYGACISSGGNISIDGVNGATLTINADAAKAQKQSIAGIFAKNKTVTIYSGITVNISSSSDSNGGCYGIYGNVSLNSAELNINTSSTQESATVNYGISGTAAFNGTAKAGIKVNPGKAPTNACVGGQVTYSTDFTGNTYFVNGDDSTKTDGTNPALKMTPVFSGVTKTTFGSTTSYSTTYPDNVYRYGRYDYSCYAVSKCADAGSANAITAEKLCADIESVQPVVGKELVTAVVHDDYSLRIGWSNYNDGNELAAGTKAEAGKQYTLWVYILPTSYITVRRDAYTVFNAFNSSPDTTLPKYSYLFSLFAFPRGLITETELGHTSNGTYLRADLKAIDANAPSISADETTVKTKAGEKVTMKVDAKNCSSLIWEINPWGISGWTTLSTGNKTELTYTPKGDFGGTLIRVTGRKTGYEDVTVTFKLLEDSGLKFTQQPVTAKYGTDGTVKFTVKAESDYDVTYQWYYVRKDGRFYAATGTVDSVMTFSGGTTDTLTITQNASYAVLENMMFYCQISDKTGAVITSNYVSVLPLAKITITQQPADSYLSGGTTASFTVKASSDVSISYQWYIDATPLKNQTYNAGYTVSGATTDTLTITGVIPYLTSQNFRCLMINTDNIAVYSDKVWIFAGNAPDPDPIPDPEPEPEPDPDPEPDPEEVTFLAGDIDNDGDVDVTDARIALRTSIKITDVNYDFTITTNREFKAANVDNDDEITVKDARLILRYAVKLITSFD